MSLGTFGGSDRKKRYPGGFSGSEGGAGLSLLDRARDELKEGIEGAHIVTRRQVGNFTRDTTAASGTQAVTGVGFRPVAVIFFAVDQGATTETSIGFTDGTTHECITRQPAGNFADTTNKSIMLEQVAGTDQYYVDAITMDIDGFTVTWTKVGAPTGTASIMYIALARG